MRTLTLRRTFVAAVFAAAAIAFPAAAHAQDPAEATACAGTDVVAGADTIPTVRSATVCLVNELRSRHGLVSVKGQPQLARAAEAHAADMVARQYFSHTDLTGGAPSTRIIRAGYVKQGGKWIVGENLGAGGNATAATIMEAWLDSPTHRAVLLKPEFRDIGLGIVVGSPVAAPEGVPTATFVAEFGVRTKASSKRFRSRR